jgi:hypothetical protein
MKSDNTLQIGGFNFELNHRYEYSIPQGDAINEDIVQEVRDLLREENMPPLPDDFSFRWEIGSSVSDPIYKLRGTLPKRISSYYYKHCDKLSIHPNILAEIGQKMSQNLPAEKEIIFDLDTRLEWKPGLFGESTGSCYWQSKCGSRYYIKDHNGGALRFFNKSGRGIARCWFLPVKGDNNNDVIVMFNNYGWALYSMVRVLATMSGLSYKKVEFSSTDGILYLNSSDDCYIAGKADDIQIKEVKARYDGASGDYNGYGQCKICKTWKPRIHLLTYVSSGDYGICKDCGGE